MSAPDQRPNGPGVERSAESDALDQLIGAHRVAMDALGDAFSRIDDELPGGPISWQHDEITRCDAEEQRVLHALLAWRPVTIAGSTERLRYMLTDRCGPWHFTMPKKEELDLLFASMTEE